MNKGLGVFQSLCQTLFCKCDFRSNTPIRTSVDWCALIFHYLIVCTQHGIVLQRGPKTTKRYFGCGDSCKSQVKLLLFRQVNLYGQ